MRRRYLLVIFFGLLVSGEVHAWIDRDGTVLPDTENQKGVDGFGAWLLLVDDEEEFFRRWGASTPLVDIDTVDRVERGEFITAFVVFGGCMKDRDGRCDVSVDFRIKNPDGTDYSFIPDQRAWNNYSGPEPGFLVLSQAYLKIRIEPDEFTGKYIVEAAVRDMKAGRSVLLSSRFVAYASKR